MRLGPDLAYPETERLRELLSEARDLVDLVIIDGPPLLEGEEGVRIASTVDKAILVAVTGKTNAVDVAAAKQRLDSTGVEIIGLVTTARPSWLVRRIGDRTVSYQSRSEERPEAPSAAKPLTIPHNTL